MVQLAEQSGIPASRPPLLHYPRCYKRRIVLLGLRQKVAVSRML